MKTEIEWRDVTDGLPNYGVPVLLSVGWPNEGRHTVVVGERNISSERKDFGEDYWWIYGPQGGQRAEANYIGLPTHWAWMPRHACLAGPDLEKDKQ